QKSVLSKWLRVMIYMAMLTMLAVGCSSGQDAESPRQDAHDVNDGNTSGNTNGGNDSQEPAWSLDEVDETVSLKIYAPMDDAVFDAYFLQPVQKKFPSVTLERLAGGGVGGLEQLLAQGIVPDLLYLLPGWY